MLCPNCNKEIPDTLIAKHLASKGGKKMISNLSQEELIKRAEKMREAKKNKNHITNKVVNNYFEDKMVDFVLRERLCDKHMKEFIKKNNLQNRKDLDIVQLLGICHKCNKGGIVYYISGKIDNGKRKSTKPIK